MSSDQESAPRRGIRKRRKLNPRVESSSRDENFSGSSDQIGSEEDIQSPGTKRFHERTEPQKPRHRIHIVKNNTLLEDEFFSQIPNASQSPDRLRGAYWQRERPAPPSPNLPLVELERNDASSGLTPQTRDGDGVLSLDSGNRQSRSNTAHKNNAGLQQEVPRIRHSQADHETALLDELADFPLDMLSSPADLHPFQVESAHQVEMQSQGPSRPRSRAFLAGPRTNLRQTTLFGAHSSSEGPLSQAPQSNKVHNWPMANRDEPPTHHELNEEELQTWIYPTNLGATRDYQFNIVSRGLFHNLLVALPTGLGKTFIAAAIMLNWFRWTKDAQIVFVAPTRPLVAQQVKACFEIAGIPRSATSLLTGNVSPGLRAEEWAEKRVFFMTPQTIVNDLKSGICDPKRIVLVVVDEAHRATGNYAYVEVVKFLRRFNSSFRVLALTATPGSTIESVQEVIDGLGIARTEIRTEESIDIRQYVHQRSIDTMLFDYSDDTQFVMDLFSSAIKPVLQTVNSMNVYWSKDPMSLTAYGCTQARQKWMASPAGRNANFGLKGMVNSILTVLASLAHAIELLKFHGIGPFYHKVLAYQNEDAENGKKGSKYKKQIFQHQDFKTMMSTIRQWINKEDFLGHPKLEYLSRVALNHFIDAGEGRGVEPDVSPTATRIMIFAHFRDSAEEIVRVLQRHSPMIRPHVFVGQAASRGSEGMDQKKQQSIIDDFKKGVYNTLVATSIGEEGLDIGQVDLIICYDASASPIRMLQRMGRTGRKRAGNIVVLLMKKKEQENFEKAKDNYEKMQQMIAEGTRFAYHNRLSPRIIPRGIQPEVDKRAVEIPIENSQADGELPEPKKKGRPPKRPPKKFHMPDGVITGFLKASEVDGTGNTTRKRKSVGVQSLVPQPLPDIETVLLTAAEDADLEKRYLDIGGDEVQTVEYPRLNLFTELQRQERPSKFIGHGAAAWRAIQLFNTMHDMDESSVASLQEKLNPEDKLRADAALQGDDIPLDNPPKSIETLTDKRNKSCRQGGTETGKGNARAPKRTSKAGKKRNSRRAQPTMPSGSSAPGTEGEGIDLMNTDDEHEHDDEDDEDDGSDLLDFINDDTPDESSSLTSSMPQGSSGREGATVRGGNSGDQAVFAAVSSQFTDADLPNVDALLGNAQDSSSRPYQRRQRRDRRVLLEDSDE